MSNDPTKSSSPQIQNFDYSYVLSECSVAVLFECYFIVIYALPSMFSTSSPLISTNYFMTLNQFKKVDEPKAQDIVPSGRLCGRPLQEIIES